LRAAFFRLPGQVELREAPDLQPTAGQVLVRILASGICGSDDYAYRIGQELGGLVREGWHRRGHEYAGASSPRALTSHGSVSRSGRGHGSLPCGECAACRRGSPDLCSHGRWCGGEGFSEYLCHDEEWYLPIPDLTAEQGALIEPLTVAMEMVQRRRREDGQQGAHPGGRAHRTDGDPGVPAGRRGEGLRLAPLPQPRPTRRGRVPRRRRRLPVGPDDVVSALHREHPRAWRRC